MPDDPQLVRGIDWKTTFPFTHIFRTFRVAIHPSKLVLGLLALVLMYAGGRVLDSIWLRSYSAVPGEIGIYESTRGEINASQRFNAERDDARHQIDALYQARLGTLPDKTGGLSAIKRQIIADRNAAVEKANTDYKHLVDAKSPDLDAARAARDRATADAYTNASTQWQAYQAVKGVGLFRIFLQYEITQTHFLVEQGFSGNWLGAGGMLDRFVLLLTVAPAWGITHHFFFFLIFGIWCLVIWAIFGGAIARIAAVQVARDEKISFRQALSFSTAKFLSFLSAPIIPLLIIVVVGLIVTAGALILFNIPFLGPILGGALFFLALAAGFVMTLVLIGLVGGFNLMYPTIAVEGSDSFDAISRSFSYLFARPWRLLFYTFVAVIYGTFCYVFVRYFIRLILALTWHFAAIGVFRHAGNSSISLWPAMWPDPLNGPLTYQPDWISLSSGESIGAFFVAFWVYFTVATLGAFAISFYFSANTIIYVLMRREVDATEMDDVHMEQSDEDLNETVTSPATSAPEPAVPAAAVTTASETVVTTETIVTTPTAPETLGPTVPPVTPAEEGQPIPETPPADVPPATEPPPADGQPPTGNP